MIDNRSFSFLHTGPLRAKSDFLKQNTATIDISKALWQKLSLLKNDFDVYLTLILIGPMSYLISSRGTGWSLFWDAIMSQLCLNTSRLVAMRDLYWLAPLWHRSCHHGSVGSCRRGDCCSSLLPLRTTTPFSSSSLLSAERGATWVSNTQHTFTAA